MRNLALVIAAATALMSLSAVPSLAGVHPVSLRLGPGILRLCQPPAQFENVCIAWGPAGPGQLAGPCLKYQMQCVSPANIQ